jgi:hypothetical protein
VVFETGQFVYNHSVIIKRDAAVLNEPLDVLTVDNVNVGFSSERRFPLRFRTDRYREPQIGEMLPFASSSAKFEKLPVKGRLPITLWAIRMLSNEQMVTKSGQCDCVFPRPISSRTAKIGCSRMKEEGGIFGSYVEIVFHRVSLQSL